MAVIRALSQNKKIRFFYTDISEAVDTIADRHGFNGYVKQLFGELAVGTVLLSTDIKSDEYTFSSVLKDNEPYNTTVAVHDSHNRIKGYSHADISEKYSFEQSRGSDAVFSIVIDTGTKYPYVTQLPLHGASLSECIAEYMEHSQQQKSVIRTNCTDKRAVGAMLQPVLNSEFINIKAREAELLSMLNEILKLSNTEDVKKLLCKHSFEAACEYEISAECDCTDEKIKGVIVSLGKKEALEIIDELGVVEVTCPYCLKKYSFDRVDIEHLFGDE